MASTQKKTGSSSNTNGGGKSRASSSKSGGAKRAASQSKGRASSRKSAPQHKPLRREIGGAVCLLLALFGAIGYFKTDEGAVIEGKVATVSSVAGSSCGRYAQAALLPTLDFLKLELAASPFTSVAFDREQFTPGALAITEGLKADLAHQAAALLAKLDRA